ncbi:MAG: hypothetical protein WD042_05370 [Phycisphaeraceae bacterium]
MLRRAALGRKRRREVGQVFTDGPAGVIDQRFGLGVNQPARALGFLIDALGKHSPRRRPLRGAARFAAPIAVIGEP